tara:strand:+ start:7522 stop:7704 length:183 start_codon:yes stop_codon:yes gene_type:complete
MICPICAKEFDEPKYQPFCSRRCADVDLGRWLTGGYALPSDAAQDDEFSDPVPPQDLPRQ